jgi:hypothetical protein
MNNQQLKQQLHKQKTPLKQAVDEKLAYLKSNEVFSDPSLYCSAYKLNTEDLSFAEAFNIADSKAPNTEQNISQNNNLSNQNENKAQISLAERIYMLRGSSSVIQRTNTSRK